MGYGDGEEGSWEEGEEDEEESKGGGNQHLLGALGDDGVESFQFVWGLSLSVYTEEMTVTERQKRKKYKRNYVETWGHCHKTLAISS